jgi:hypothetical protein
MGDTMSKNSNSTTIRSIISRSASGAPVHIGDAERAALEAGAVALDDADATKRGPVDRSAEIGASNRGLATQHGSSLPVPGDADAAPTISTGFGSPAAPVAAAPEQPSSVGDVKADRARSERK